MIPQWIVVRWFSVLLCGVYCASAYGWKGFGHYRIAVEVSGVNPEFAMGPDTFKSRFSVFNITAEFAWSHAVLTDDLDITPPNKPWYPHDGRYPGPVMYELVTQKLSPQTIASMTGAPPYHADLLETAKGFVVHNASDNIVHFEHFLGGSPPPACPGWTPAFYWLDNHARKESWANYVLLILLDAQQTDAQGTPIPGTSVEFFQGPGIDNVMGTTDDTFSELKEFDANFDGIAQPSEDQNGNGILDDYTDSVFGPPQGVFSTRHLHDYLLYKYILSFKTNIKLQQLAMKVYRKNRRNTDVLAGIQSSEFEVRTLEEIENSFFGEILDPEIDLFNLVSPSAAMFDLLALTADGFESLNVTASEVNRDSGLCVTPLWLPATTIDKFNACVVRAQAWVNELGN